MDFLAPEALRPGSRGSPNADTGTWTEQYSSSTHVSTSPLAEQQSGPVLPQMLGEGAVFCQVLGCNADLSHGKTYCVKKRTCAAHMQAESVQLVADDPTLWRFCQQCGKFEPLSKFDDAKRSCRARLAKRRSGTRAQLLKKGCTTKSDNSSEDQTPGSSSATARSAKAAAAAADVSSQQNPEAGTLPTRETPNTGAQQQLDGRSLQALTSPAGGNLAAFRNRCSSPPPVLQTCSQSEGTSISSAAAAAASMAALSASVCHQSLSAPLLSFPSGAMIGMTNVNILDPQLVMLPPLDDDDADLDQDGQLDELQLIAVLQQEMQGDRDSWAQQFTQQQQQQQQQQGVLGNAISCSSMSGFAGAAVPIPPAAGGAGAAAAAAAACADNDDNGDRAVLQASGLSMPLQKVQLGGSAGSGCFNQPGSPQTSWGAAISLCVAPTLSAPLPQLSSCLDDEQLSPSHLLQQLQQQQQQQGSFQLLADSRAGAAVGAAAGCGVDPCPVPTSSAGGGAVGGDGGAAAAAPDACFTFSQQQQEQQQQQCSEGAALPAISGGGGAAAQTAAAAAAVNTGSPSTSQAKSAGGAGGYGATTSSGGGAAAASAGQAGSSRLKWLIQQVQMELQNCSTDDIENLDEGELGTLLHAALAPAAAAAAAANVGGSFTASAGAAGAAVNAAGAVDAAAGGVNAAGGAAVGVGAPAAPVTPAAMSPGTLAGQQRFGVGNAGLHQQVGQVQALQQQVQMMQQQLQLVRQVSFSAASSSQLSGGGGGQQQQQQQYLSSQLRQGSVDDMLLGGRTASGESGGVVGGPGQMVQRSLSCIPAMPAASSQLMQQQQQQQAAMGAAGYSMMPTPIGTSAMGNLGSMSSMGMQSMSMGMPAMSMGMPGMAAAAVCASSGGSPAVPTSSMLMPAGNSGCWAPTVQHEMQHIQLQAQQLALQQRQLQQAQQVLQQQQLQQAQQQAQQQQLQQVMQHQMSMASGAGAGGGMMGLGAPAAAAATAAAAAAAAGDSSANMQLAMLEAQLRQAQAMMTSLLSS